MHNSQFFRTFVPLFNQITDMKHLFQFIGILCAAITLASCEGPRGPQGPMGPQGPAGSANIYTLSIAADEWAYDPANQCFFTQVKVPQLTAEVYDFGTVSCYREYNFGTAYAYQISLPEVKHLYDAANDFYYTQTIDYSFGIGFIEIVLTTSDHYYEYVPESMDFRLNLIW